LSLLERLSSERLGMEQKIRVLIADDRPHSRDGLRALIAMWPNVEVVGEAGDGREALQLMEACRPEVVLMDVRMPVLDGLAATRRIKEHWPRVKVVILTMYPAHRSEALNAGADAFLVKGCAADELLAAICEPRASQKGEKTCQVRKP
jgi:DNA-binding NarL/FixJ family response regulator